MAIHESTPLRTPRTFVHPAFGRRVAERLRGYLTLHVVRDWSDAGPGAIEAATQTASALPSRRPVQRRARRA